MMFDPSKSILLHHSSRLQSNRDVFLLNFAAHFSDFDRYAFYWTEVSALLGKERDKNGKAHSGLLPLVNFSIRSFVFGFQAMAAYQSFSAWASFRQGLEATLIVGKMVQDPNLGPVWSDRDKDKNAYTKNFGRAQELKANNALPRAETFSKLLTAINDRFLHPNATQIGSVTSKIQIDANDPKSDLWVLTEFFDTDSEIHEANLLAYVRVTADLL